MNQKRITNLLLAIFVFIGLGICGIIGYRNDGERVIPGQATPVGNWPTETPADIELVYCYSPVNLCVVSFGSDNSGNMLMVIRNHLPGLDEFYARIDQVGTGAQTGAGIETETQPATQAPTPTPDPYPCQKVEFTRDVYYCLGSPVPDKTMVTLNIYSKDDDRLAASGRLLVSLGATPLPSATLMATPEPSASETQPASVTP